MGVDGCLMWGEWDLVGIEVGFEGVVRVAGCGFWGRFLEGFENF